MLMKEHRLIERALDAMEAWLSTIEVERESKHKAELAQFVSFVQGFADAYHHAKEEDILFVAMGEHGFPRQSGPIAVMLHEHELGRSLVNALQALAHQSAPWTQQDCDTIGQTVREFAALLRQHIRKEDQVLYPMAEARLPVPVQAEMLRSFQAFEEEQTRSGEHQRLLALADTLLS